MRKSPEEAPRKQKTCKSLTRSKSIISTRLKLQLARGKKLQTERPKIQKQFTENTTSKKKTRKLLAELIFSKNQKSKKGHLKSLDSSIQNLPIPEVDELEGGLQLNFGESAKLETGEEELNDFEFYDPDVLNGRNEGQQPEEVPPVVYSPDEENPKEEDVDGDVVGRDKVAKADKVNLAEIQNWLFMWLLLNEIRKVGGPATWTSTTTFAESDRRYYYNPIPAEAASEDSEDGFGFYDPTENDKNHAEHLLPEVYSPDSEKERAPKEDLINVGKLHKHEQPEKEKFDAPEKSGLEENKDDSEEEEASDLQYESDSGLQSLVSSESGSEDSSSDSSQSHSSRSENRDDCNCGSEKCWKNAFQRLGEEQLKEFVKKVSAGEKEFEADYSCGKPQWQTNVADAEPPLTSRGRLSEFIRGEKR